MRVILFRPCYDRIYTFYKDALPEKRDVRTPEGLLYLAAVAERDGHDVFVVDGHAELLDTPELVKRIAELKPDIVGTGGTTPEFVQGCRELANLKEATGCATVVGGPHASALPAQTLNDEPHIDYVVRNEGEHTFSELLQALQAKADLAKVEGLAYRVDGKPALTPPRAPIADLDALPSPAFHLVPMERYHFPDPVRGVTQMASLITSRGCPFGCIFCYSMHGKKIRYRSPKPVVDEIQSVTEKYGARYFFFHDETFTFERDRTLAILQDIIDRKLNIEWTCMTRAASLDDELVAKMAESGCTRASLGIESGNEEILKTVRKQSDQDTLRQAYRLLARHGIEGRGSLIIGLPGETDATMRETVDFVKTLDVKVAAFNVVTPYPGTMLYDMARRGDRIHLDSTNWEDFRRWGNAVAHTDDLSREDLLRWQRRATTEFYTQPKMIAYYLRKWATLKHPAYYLRPFRNSVKMRAKCMLRGDFKLAHI